jgi:O-acetyl-ADP-ribose deacetylase
MTELTAEIGQTILEVIVADITTLDVDAIVNAANRTLLGGGGVDGAVGPVWAGGGKNEEALLAGCYRTALDLAASSRLKSIAYPAVSTGIYRFPADLAARIAVGTVAAEIAARPRGMTRVIFCCFAPESADHHKNAFAELGLV